MYIFVTDISMWHTLMVTLSNWVGSLYVKSLNNCKLWFVLEKVFPICFWIHKLIIGPKSGYKYLSFYVLGSSSKNKIPSKVFGKPGQSIFLENVNTTLIKRNIEKINNLVSDIQSNVNNEISSIEANSVDISFENILLDPDKFDAEIEDHLTPSASNVTLHTVIKLVKSVQEIVFETSMLLSKKWWNKTVMNEITNFHSISQASIFTCMS